MGKGKEDKKPRTTEEWDVGRLDRREGTMGRVEREWYEAADGSTTK